MILDKSQFLDDLKNYLDITWEDNEGDKKLLGIIGRGTSYIETAAGMELDFDQEDKPRELLMEYCRYARSHGLEDFQVNFLPELLGLQIGAEVGRYDQ